MYERDINFSISILCMYVCTIYVVCGIPLIMMQFPQNFINVSNLIHCRLAQPHQYQLIRRVYIKLHVLVTSTDNE